MFLLFLRWKEAKIKTAPARAKTPSLRLNGNELASLRQISVLIAFVQGFLNARSDEVGSSFAARLRHRLSSRECASLFLSTRAGLRHRLFSCECALLFLFLLVVLGIVFFLFRWRTEEGTAQRFPEGERCCWGGERRFCEANSRGVGDAAGEPRKGLASAEGALKKYVGKPEKRKAVWAQRVLSARLSGVFLAPAA